LNKIELERYTRHILLKEIGGSGQKLLKKSSITMVGAGGLGSIILYYLAAAGIGNIKIVDDDIVSLSNLQRQILFKNEDLGNKKVIAAKKNLLSLNPQIKIEIFDEKFNEKSSKKLINNCDILIDGTDNYKSKSSICKIAFNETIPLVYGGLSQWEGQVCFFDPKSDSICFGCIFPNDPGQEFEDSCLNFGIIGPIVGVIGSLMAAEVIKFLTSSGKPITNKILTYDCLQGEFQEFVVEKIDSCNICSNLNNINYLK
tara:strand:- start:165 stop:935 length:771 start_codon:yes stop_codon:yes gene_type:complete